MTITVTAAPDLASTIPRITVSLSTTTSAPNPVAANALITVFRVDPDGVSRPVIITAGQQLSGGSAVLNDYHAPFNVPVSYTAVFGTSSGNTATPTTLASSSSWLIDDINPAKSLKVDAVSEIGDRTRVSTASLHWPFGSQYPVSLTEGTRLARSGQLIVRVASKAQQTAIDALLADSGSILMNLANNGGWWDETWAWIQPANVVYGTQVLGGGQTSYPYRKVTIPYQVVDTPAGAAIPVWTWTMVGTTYASWTAFSAAYTNWNNAAVNTQ